MSTPNKPEEPPPPPPTKEDADEARAALEQLRRVGTIVTTALLVLGGGGLIFTCVNVTVFAMKHDVEWFIAWMLDPLASLALLAVLYVDGILAQQGYRPTGWPFLLRWFAGVSTWLMNCWSSLYPNAEFTWWPKQPDAAGLLLHSVVPFLVIILAEAGAGYRKYLARRTTELKAIIRGYQELQRQEREAEAERLRKEKREDEERARWEKESKAREAREKDEREARERSEREAREAERESARQAHEQELARIAAERDTETARLQAEADGRIREAREKAALDREQEAWREEREARKRADEEARKKEEAQAKAREAARREAEENAAKNSSLPAPRGSASTNRGAAKSTPRGSQSEESMTREAKAKQREAAEREAARLILADAEPTAKEFGEAYGNGETWGGDRLRAARRRLKDEDGFQDAVETEALERLYREEAEDTHAV